MRTSRNNAAAAHHSVLCCKPVRNKAAGLAACFESQATDHCGAGCSSLFASYYVTGAAHLDMHHTTWRTMQRTLQRAIRHTAPQEPPFAASLSQLAPSTRASTTRTFEIADCVPEEEYVSVRKLLYHPSRRQLKNLRRIEVQSPACNRTATPSLERLVCPYYTVCAQIGPYSLRFETYDLLWIQVRLQIGATECIRPCRSLSHI